MRMNQTSLDEKPIAKPAHLGWRLMALLYDAVISIALLMCSSAIVVLINQGSPVTPGGLSAFAAFLFFWVILGIYAICSWRYGGQTLGMRPWRLKVLTLEGKVPSWRALCLRYSIASLTFGLGALWSFFDADRRALYDLASGTIFVRMLSTKSA